MKGWPTGWPSSSKSEQSMPSPRATDASTSCGSRPLDCASSIICRVRLLRAPLGRPAPGRFPPEGITGSYRASRR